MNQLFNVLGGNSMPPILQQFQQFKSAFRGDARSQVQQMLNSGQITQEQFNKAAQLASQFQRMLK